VATGLTPAEQQELEQLRAELSTEGPGERKPDWERDLQAHINQYVMPQEPFSVRRQGANLLRVGGPMAVGAATGGLGLIPALAAAAGAGGASEYGAEKIEGDPTDSFRIALATFLGGGARTGRGVVEGVRGGGPRINAAMKAGGAEPVDPTKLLEALQDAQRRVGPTPTAASTGRVLNRVEERLTRPGPVTLQDVEDIRRTTGSDIRTFKSPDTKQAAEQIYGASKGTMEQAAAGGSKAAEQTLEGISAEAARKGLTQRWTLTDTLRLLGGLGGGLGGYGLGGAPGAAPAALGLMPILQRLYGATAAMRPHPILDAAIGGTANVGLQNIRR
jgi:hypothetical protein